MFDEIPWIRKLRAARRFSPALSCSIVQLDPEFEVFYFKNLKPLLDNLLAIPVSNMNLAGAKKNKTMDCEELYDNKIQNK